MSLILDALRKLEREKDAREPGVLVVGAVPWGARSPSRRPLLLAFAGLALAGILAFALWGPSRDPATRVPSVPSALSAPGSPVASPVDAALPTPAPSPTAPGATARPAPRPAPSAPAARRESVPTAAAPATVDAHAGSRAEDEAASPIPPPEAPPPGSLRLNAISQRDGRPVALINERLVFEGDSFDGVRVLRIGEVEVEVEVHGTRRVLRF